MRFVKLLIRVQKEIPGIRVLRRDQSLLMRMVFWFLRSVLRMKRNYGGFTTTIWRTLYVPATFDTWASDERYRLLRHELTHLRQFRNWPIKALGRPYFWVINACLMSLCYTLVLPVFWTFRAKFEREGYTQTMLADYEMGELPPQRQAMYIDRMEETFGGSVYFYMWRRKAAREWAQQTLSDILTEKIVNTKDRIDMPLPLPPPPRKAA